MPSGCWEEADMVRYTNGDSQVGAGVFILTYNPKASSTSDHSSNPRKQCVRVNKKEESSLSL